MMNRPQNPEEGENPSRTSKPPAGGAVLLILGSLLAVTFVIIYRLSFVVVHNRESFQTLEEENEALRRNISELKSTEQPTCPPCLPTPEEQNLFEEERWLKKIPEWEKYRGSFYYFSSTKSSWNDSRRSCMDLGSDLVKIDSREEQTFLEIRLRPMMKNDLEKFWIGLMDSEEEGRWFWVDGSPLNKSLSFWMPWEPDDMKADDPSGEDCGGMGKKGGADDLTCWFDQFCGLQRRSICEKPDLPTTESPFDD
ncbi:C-type lectin domain family 4 member E-like [Poeciliopsis prolifica]|uniref:C-type lectin domain family 4 member E-like n=1 Tax=Poeciliopsis prolifica TaxID=188132 RepID=UPI002413FD47|nr:C-type lectin domain family 4 member E-like [Poeciliopsis prolifica]XP_054911278.1 C-type lectin domain family 4 member E-like [Poeciliopsis prolifica]